MHVRLRRTKQEPRELRLFVEGMPRYHFDLVDKTTSADQGGQILSDDDEAMEVADTLATQLRVVRPDLIGKGYMILVTDENGREVYRARIDRMH